MQLSSVLSMACSDFRVDFREVRTDEVGFYIADLGGREEKIVANRGELWDLYYSAASGRNQKKTSTQRKLIASVVEGAGPPVVLVSNLGLSSRMGK